MTNGSDSNVPDPGDPENRAKQGDGVSEGRTTAKELAREFRFVEVAQLVVNGVLAVIGVVALCIYHGQLKVMRVQLGEIIRQYPEIKESADAAKSAADTADQTLKNSQKIFETDQRPYLVATAPVFSGNGLVADKDITVNITFKNIGRTPAVKYIANLDLLRFDPSQGSKGRARVKSFLMATFDKLRAKDTLGRKEIEGVGAEVDVAPNDTVFVSNPQPVVLSTADFPKLQTSAITLFCAGVISYTDSFHKQYKTEFCEFYYGVDPKTWHICDSHNTIE